MKTGDKVKLKMEQPFRVGMVLDDNVYEGKLQRFDDTEESLYLLLTDAMLPDISLDAIYKCEIFSQIEQIVCTGRVRERYHGVAGKTLKLEIKNGFSKINLK